MSTALIDYKSRVYQLRNEYGFKPSEPVRGWIDFLIGHPRYLSLAVGEKITLGNYYIIRTE